MKQASVYKFHCRNPKLKLDLQSQKKISLLISITILLNVQIDKLADRSDLETILASSVKNFELHGNQFICTEIVDHNHREIHHLYKNRFYVANNGELIESKYDV